MRSELRAKLWMGLSYFVVLEALLVAAMLYWPQFAKNLEHLKSLIPLEVLREMADRIDESGASAYVHAQHFFKGCNALGGLVAVMFAMNAVAAEAQRGTLEIWLARPLSRRRLLLARWFAGAFWISVPVLVSTGLGKGTAAWVAGLAGLSTIVGRIFGGWLMAQVDLAGAVLPSRVAKGRIATVAVNQFLFKQTVSVGDLLSFYARIERIGTTSITVHMEVYAERNPANLQVVKVTEANLTYVAIDSADKPRPIPRE